MLASFGALTAKCIVNRKRPAVECNLVKFGAQNSYDITGYLLVFNVTFFLGGGVFGVIISK